MNRILIPIIAMLLLVGIAGSQLNTTNEITTLDKEKLNLTKAEKGIIDGNYENLKLGNVIDYQKGTHHTFINFDSGYRIITINKNFEKMKDGK